MGGETSDVRKRREEVQAAFNTRENEPDRWNEDFSEPDWHRSVVRVGVDHTPSGTAVVTARQNRETGVIEILDSAFDTSETDYVPSVESTPDYIRRLIRERNEAREKLADAWEAGYDAGEGADRDTYYWRGHPGGTNPYRDGEAPDPRFADQRPPACFMDEHGRSKLPDPVEFR